MASIPSNKMDAADRAAFMAATEAVLGLLAQQKPVTTEAVQVWLQRSLNGDTNAIARATSYANRMIAGPFSADWPRAVA